MIQSMIQFLIVFIVFAFGGHLYADEFISVVTEDWKPYNYEENGVVKGESTEIVRSVLDRAGTPYGIQVYPWARAYDMALHRENVLIYTIIRIPVREKLFHWVRPLADSDTTSLYRLSKRNDIVIRSLEDVKHYRVGVVKDSMGHLYLLNQGFQDDIHMEEVTAQRQNVAKLLANRVDLIIYSQNNLLAELNHLGVSENTLQEEFFLFKTYPYMAFSKNTSVRLVKKVQNAYDQLVREGKVKRFK